MRLFLSVVLLCCFIQIQAQYKRAFPDLFTQTAGWTKSGWLAAIGATYTLPVNKKIADYVINSTYKGDLRTFSAPGIYAELGRFYQVPAGIIFNQLDYSVSFKQLNYNQDLHGYDRLSKYPISDKARWQDQSIGLNFNLNSIIQVANYSWIQPSIGIHGDYVIGGKKSYNTDSSLFNYTLPTNKFNLQLHAKLAYGMKLTSELFVVPSLEIALWSLNDLVKFRVPKSVFNSNYTPVIFAVKFLLHRPLSMRSCDVKPEEVDLSKTKRKKKKVRLF